MRNNNKREQMGNNNVLCVWFEKSYTHCPLSRIKINSLSILTCNSTKCQQKNCFNNNNISSKQQRNGTNILSVLSVGNEKQLKLLKICHNFFFILSCIIFLFTEANGEKQTFQPSFIFRMTGLNEAQYLYSGNVNTVSFEAIQTFHYTHFGLCYGI